MPKLVDLKAKPYNLSDKQVAWVNETIAGMTDEEKVGQLFTNLFFFGNDAFSGNDFTNQEIVEKFHIGGARYHGNSKEDIQDLLNDLQSMSKIPLLVAANCDSGGKVYQNHIDRGVEMIMAGHIAVPALQKELNPALEDKDIMPATLAEELIQDALKTELGFNGLVITDATHMLGMTSAMRREDYVPKSIAAGCDMFLFFNNIEEDFGFMLKGYQNGVITEERLTDALRRILGLKAKLHLPEKQANGTLLRTREDLNVIGCEEHLQWRAEAADKGISLIKDTQNNLPINPVDHKRIRLYMLEGEKGGITDNGSKAQQLFVDELTKRGYEVTVNERGSRVKGATLKYRDEVDFALEVADIAGYGAQNNYRIQWSTAMANEVPWFVWEVPHAFVSLNFTTHLHDATMVKTFVNAYHNNEETIKQVIDKLEGKSEFKGGHNDLVWTDKWQAKL